MKTTLEYLEEQKDMACHNLLCYSKTYGMDTPKEGHEENHAKAVRDLGIVEELIILVKKNETSKEQKSHYNERKEVIDKIVHLIITELQEPGKGNLTTKYVIGLLQETITVLETSALMKPPKL